MEKAKRTDVKVDCGRCRWLLECDPLAMALAAAEGCGDFAEAADGDEETGEK